MRPLVSPLCLSVVTLLLAAACEDNEYSALYHSDDKAPSLSVEGIEALQHLGPTLTDQGVNFSLFSERATRVELLVFEDPESNQPTRQFPMKRFGNVWNVYVEGLGVGTHYGYIAWGPNWVYDPNWHCGQIDGFIADVDGQGNRFNPNKLLHDPYGKALHRDHDWSKGSLASGPMRTQCTFAAAAKSVVYRSDYAWSAEAQAFRKNRQNPDWEGHRWNDLIIYEVHPKGFTANSASKVEHPGTYRGFAEKADYLKDLGVTAVELLPIHEKPSDGGYWGYQTLNFFAPEQTYASRQEWRFVTDEFKYMVDELHKRNIEVIVDVVYNHTGEGGLWRDKIEVDLHPEQGIISEMQNYDPEEVAGIHSFRGIDNYNYYALDPSGKTYWNNTGVGNQTRANNLPFRKLIIDSLRYYVEELHVDGFRFDLAPILGTSEDDFNAWLDARNSVLQDIIDDPVLKKYNTRIIAEPWLPGGCFGSDKGSAQCVSANPLGWFPRSTQDERYAWAEWNPHFRDLWRGLLNQEHVVLKSKEGVSDVGNVITGSSELYQNTGNKPSHVTAPAKKPYHSVNFITVHDGFTLADLFTYEKSQNLCGPLNPICCSAPESPFCERHAGDDRGWGNGYRSKAWGSPQDPADARRRQLMRTAITSMMISHGTPMLLGGDEWARTQLGNSNAYSTWADNPYNWFDWGVWETQDWRHRLKDFVKQAIRVRKKYAYAFAPLEWDPALPGGPAPFQWKHPDNTPASSATWDGKSIMMHYYDASRGPELVVLINAEQQTVNFTLPPGKVWRRVLDTQMHFDTAEYIDGHRFNNRLTRNVTLDNPEVVPGSTYGAAFKSIVILEAAP